MALTRRTALVGGFAALSLAACGRAPGAAVTRAPEVSLPTAPNPGWDAWVAGFRPRAMARGISQPTLDAAFRDAGFIPGVVERDRNQTEFTRTLEDYLAIAASPERIANGQAKLAQHGDTLRRIEARWGVEPHVVTAVWGMESAYGTRKGAIPVISSTSTLAFDGRRGGYFEGELTAALRILQSGDITPARMTGSWAGAMGHTQFMPTSYLDRAVDFTGDGRRDIWSEDPTDALASTAAYLSGFGWQTGRPWGIEVRLPAGFDTGVTGRDRTRGAGEWSGLGVRTVEGGALPDHGAAAVILPQGAAGPAFMIWRNFTVISRYNNAVNYIIGVGHLSDRIIGGPPVRAAFPPDAQGMTQANRLALQQGLQRAGYDVGTPDGVIGTRTIAAIESFEASRGLPVTGLATPALLALLR